MRGEVAPWAVWQPGSTPIWLTICKKMKKCRRETGHLYPSPSGPNREARPP
jgi:hypothetical protein